MNFLYKPWKNGSGFIVKNNLTPKLEFVDRLKDGKINYNDGIMFFELENIPIKKIHHNAYNVCIGDGSEVEMISIFRSL